MTNSNNNSMFCGHANEVPLRPCDCPKTCDCWEMMHNKPRHITYSINRMTNNQNEPFVLDLMELDSVAVHAVKTPMGRNGGQNMDAQSPSPEGKRFAEQWQELWINHAADEPRSLALLFDAHTKELGERITELEAHIENDTTYEALLTATDKISILEKKLTEQGSLLEWIEELTLDDSDVSDFALSFPLVRKIADLRARDIESEGLCLQDHLMIAGLNKKLEAAKELARHARALSNWRNDEACISHAAYVDLEDAVSDALANFERLMEEK